MADAGKWYKRGRRCLRGGGGGGEKERSEMGLVEQIIIIKKMAGEKGRSLNAVAARRGKRRRLPSPSHTFSSPRRSSKLVFLCVLCGHTTSTGGENIKRQRALAAQTLSQGGKQEQNRHVLLVPRQRFSGQGEGCLGLSLSVRKQKRKKEAAW